MRFRVARAHKDVLTTACNEICLKHESNLRPEECIFCIWKKARHCARGLLDAEKANSRSALVVMCSAGGISKCIKKTSCLIIFVYGTLFCGNYTKSAVFEVDKKVGSYYFSSVVWLFYKCMQRSSSRNSSHPRCENKVHSRQHCMPRWTTGCILAPPRMHFLPQAPWPVAILYILCGASTLCESFLWSLWLSTRQALRGPCKMKHCMGTSVHPCCTRTLRAASSRSICLLATPANTHATSTLTPKWEDFTFWKLKYSC